MNKIILKQINDLQKKIESGEYLSETKKVREWGGADVIIDKKMTPQTERWLGDQSLVISFQNTAPRKRVVITPYSKELSWLFYQLGGIFRDRIDYISKYDFYGLLAQSAIDFIDMDEDYKCEELLLTVLNQSLKFNDNLYLDHEG